MTLTEDMGSIINQKSIPWERLANKTVMITGASGFLASYMVETLLYLNSTKNFKIVILAVVRKRENFLEKFGRDDEKKGLVCVESDVCDVLDIEDNIDYIIHAASQASPKYYSTDPVGTLAANTVGTANLLELARAKKVAGFLYFSSAEVYGEARKVPTSESDYGYLDPLNIRSCYAESKRMGENMCVSWSHQFGVPTKIVRPFHTYGPRMKLDDGRVYADFVSDVVNGRDIILKSDGLAKRSFCYIADAVVGFWMVLLKGEDATAYNIGNPENEISIFNLAHLIAETYPENNISVNIESRAKQDNYLASQIDVACPDISLMKKLGWLPTTSLKNGFRKTIKSYLK